MRKSHTAAAPRPQKKTTVSVRKGEGMTPGHVRADVPPLTPVVFFLAHYFFLSLPPLSLFPFVLVYTA
jgi:hypothetical protein